MQYRDYQEWAVRRLFQFFEEHPTGNPVVAMPTGTGKSVVIGGFIKEVMTRFPRQKIVKLTHVKELIQQNMDKLLTLWPTAPAGVYSAGLGRKEIDRQIIYAGIASAVKVAERFGHVDLVLIDEAHLVSPKQNTMYAAFLEKLQTVNPNLRVIGFTATNYRMGQGMLTEPGGLFTHTPVDMTGIEPFNWFIAQGYLVPLVPYRTETQLNVEGVRTSGGEYKQGELQAAVDRDEITRVALEEAADSAQDRKCWMVFATGIDHTEHVTDRLNAMGIPATCVHSKTPAKVRDQRLQDLKRGKYRAMVNNGVLTTGFDHPGIDAEIILRPTRSPGLWVQILGRGTRPVYEPGHDLTTPEGRNRAIQESDKQDCLVLDFAGNTARLGPINDPVLPKPPGQKKKGNAVAPVRLCDECNCYNHASARTCVHCGAEFPRSVGIHVVPGTDDLIAQVTPKIETFRVDHVAYSVHNKPGRPPSLRVNYFCGLRRFTEWVCFEHKGLPLHKSHEWWRNRAEGEVPQTVKEALERLDEVKAPTSINVWLNKKYPEVMSYDFTELDQAVGHQ